MRVWLTGGLLVALLLSGCSGDGIPVESTDAEPSSLAEPAPAAWTNQTLEGTFAGVGTPVVSFSPLVALGDGYGTHSFAVAEAAQTLHVTLHLVVDGPFDVQLRLIEPGCQSPSCSHDMTTAGGMADLEIPSPVAGEWRTAMFQVDSGAGATPYHLSVGVLA